ncbi:cysteine synthase family protein [Flavobacteriales bacterium]|nr:cysteine synthase family protein [Flavobacteriales bacterium]
MELIKENRVEDKSLIEGLEQLEKFIGNTPLYPFNRLFQKQGVKIYAKLEWQQFGASVKSRPAFEIVKNAIFAGELDRNKTLLDASSGNTGIAYASICGALGIPVALCIPANASIERIRNLKSLGAELILTSQYESTDGAQNKAKEMFAAHPEKYFYADQYGNDSNWEAHYKTTGPEIVEQLGDEKITHFMAGLGTTGTMRGTGTYLKEQDPNTQVIALHPDSAMHAIEGWKHMETALVPKIYNAEQADDNQEISTEESFALLKDISQKEGLLIGPSGAANLVGAIRLANQLEEGVIVTIIPDSADKYSEVYEQLFK